MAERDWAYTLTNASGTAGITEPQLSRVEGTLTVPDSGADGVRSFSGMDSQIKAVSAVRFTNKQIVLTARRATALCKIRRMPGTMRCRSPGTK